MIPSFLPLGFTQILASISVAIVLYQYIPYIRSVFAGKTKPHIFSWFIWGVLTAIAFAGQVVDGAGAGAWVTGFTACGCIIICLSCYRYGERSITRSDWWSFIAGLSAIPAWLITKEPLTAMLIITLIDALAFYPTFRKSWYKPNEELLQTYMLSGTKFLLAIIALENFTPTTWLYPASLVLMNWGFVAMVFWRRKRLRQKES
jgi:hypothetical protein